MYIYLIRSYTSDEIRVRSSFNKSINLVRAWYPEMKLKEITKNMWFVFGEGEITDSDPSCIIERKVVV